MIAFHRSSFLWKSHPWKAHPYYKYDGGFVGRIGQIYYVRFHLEAACRINDGINQASIYLGAPCRTEYTIASSNFFQSPSNEWRMAFSHDCQIPISKKLSTEKEITHNQLLKDLWQNHQIDIRQYDQAKPLTEAHQVIDATLNHDLMNVKSTYVDEETGLEVELEYPVDIMNINEEDDEFQVCTGPVLLPDLSTWDGHNIHRSFLADVALSSFDYVEFILRRAIDVADHEKSWYEQPIGRDRYELTDPDKKPESYPPERPKPMVYHEVWEKTSGNIIIKTDNV